ncbi:hypothetical protein [Bradyrhizobium sp. AUGA SZCCT0283]|uniref:hypothetical protein n=1 Tax=Bradyrhizobium sp. AUGA SZCCT0283 TaxID=2807671 RepID=UPI001BADE7B0|nr:hypothetical protein [Bradyrhizobium sp. AUGA SZCCT0283]MBR1277918.1 hypothetical protein [Bradyrhizobium sp. AUGA SZCCT0283]
MTLRSAYFADWKGGAIVLLWGDATGMRDLRDFLRLTWAAPNAPTLDRFCEAVDGRMIAVRAVSDQRDTGMRLARDGLEWRLQPDLAEDFAEMVDVLASSVSGHQYLETRGSDISVEVSIGEYPETLRPDSRGF